MPVSVKRIVIMGAAGRDFHNFNVVFRDDPSTRVVAFTAAQIPGIAERCYPEELAGPRYPGGIRIVPEQQLLDLIERERINQVVFAYSDVTHLHVMHQASIALAAGADFALLGPNSTMLKSILPVIAVCAVRTGVGKSQTTRYLSRLLKQQGRTVAVVRHPMPYGNLASQRLQRFETLADLDRAECTLEEREEYERHIEIGNMVYAGVDYAQILKQIELECDTILWDGGNNDFPFYRPDITIVLVDPMRVGHETTYHPGEAVLRMADVVVVAKANAASNENVVAVTESAKRLAPRATIARGASRITLDDPAKVRNKRVLVIEDGPTVTHGGMPNGAGLVAAREAGAGEVVDPPPVAIGRIAEVLAQYEHIGNVVPAMGYSERELIDLRATIEAAQPDAVIAGTPCDLARLIDTRIPIVSVHYEYDDVDEPHLADIVTRFLHNFSPMSRGSS